tara:strand:- start:670 stop:1242 length:573 start_codon:yes stop_codon:yes gene_type:complete
MTRNTITDITRITEALDLTGAIESYLWDELTDGNYWHSIGDIARQLETASCANGSWNQMIYTRDILERLSDPDWQDGIDEAWWSYADETGESPDITTLESAVTFAVDQTASNLAHRLRSLDSVAVVTASVDTLDPSPDVIAFADESDALDWVAGEIERRIQHRVDHSPYTITDADLEIESQLFTITEESI